MGRSVVVRAFTRVPGVVELHLFHASRTRQIGPPFNLNQRSRWEQFGVVSMLTRVPNDRHVHLFCARTALTSVPLSRGTRKRPAFSRGISPTVFTGSVSHRYTVGTRLWHGFKTMIPRTRRCAPRLSPLKGGPSLGGSSHRDRVTSRVTVRGLRFKGDKRVLERGAVGLTRASPRALYRKDPRSACFHFVLAGSRSPLHRR